ncbi:tRNA (guanine(37)-N1)-methyltransferase-like [Bradysia coprophila]|uniref:tRNA (guanine(37)-N1)-methyltransferase-like n=1 Tax=Bradysia coprophila TaxID=38358 RepID=UPI00187DB00D|nr:tRNA (guanine(37)-N1)-methyltransferase-like [Bradysia coprophila]
MFVGGLLQKSIQRNFCLYRNMVLNELLPPKHVRRMTVLDREQFRQTVSLPVLDLSNIQIHSAMPHLKKLTLKIRKLKPVQLTETGQKKLLLQPMAVKTWDGIPVAVQDLGITEDRLTWEEYELTYDNWSTEEILKSVLPEDQEALSAFSRIGHIIHLNLKDHLLPYKTLIGEVLLDKEPHCRTVINKSQTIDNTYRNFQFELLCGDSDFKATVRENGIEFEFDFSTVYWNPRLSTEHERIVKLLRHGDVLYDVFAGVGPFSVPVGKSKCTVLANDLNPESFKWLQANIRRNKVTNYVSAFNKDGREFICNEIKNDLVSRWRNNEPKDYKIHITMNLPAMAVEFLNCFCGLLSDIDEEAHPIYPLVHVYCFAKGENTSDIARKLVEDNLGQELGDNLDGIYFVRNVAPNKDMYRVSFHLTREILTAKKIQKRSKSPSPDVNVDAKKICIS